MASQQGRIINLNGTSSSGKSTLAQALRLRLEPQFHYYSSDQLADEGFRPLDKERRFAWREKFFDGFHRSIPAFASVGIDLLVEHIVEESWTWIAHTANYYDQMHMIREFRSLAGNTPERAINDLSPDHLINFMCS